MNLPVRQTKKRDQALDALASLAKTWSEWRLGDRAAKTVAVGKKKAKKAAKQARKTAKKTDVSTVTNAAKGTPLKIAGAVAVVGGVGAAVAKKLKGGGHAEPLYTPPSPAPASAVMPAPAAPADMSSVPAPEPTKVVVGDLSADAAAEPAAEAETPAPDDAVVASEAIVDAPAVAEDEPEAAASDDVEAADKS